MAFYKDVFDARGALYNHAMALCPHAREAERALLLQDLQIRPGELVVDAPAGGGYVAEALAAAGARVVCLEPSANFAAAIADRFSTHITDIHSMPLANQSTDRVASLAGLHHLPAEQLRQFFSESYRVLKPGGRLAVADIEHGTSTAEFLNGFVDQFTETGHHGAFFRAGDLHTLLQQAGFSNITETSRTFSWVFADHHTMLLFFQSLFGLVKASLVQIDQVITSQLGVSHHGNQVQVRWSLRYAHGDVPA